MSDATLRDITAAPNPLDSPTPKEPVAATPEPPTPTLNVGDADAAEIGRIILDSGYSKDQLNDILAAPQALANLKYIVSNNPQEFLNLLERTDSASADKFLEKLTDIYVERHGTRDGAPAPKSGKDGSPELMTEVSRLREQLNGFQTREQQRENAAAMASMKSRYEARVEDMFSQDAIKGMGLTSSEAKAMKARLSNELANDAQAVQRVNAGNFVDVPRKFQSIVTEWAADKKAATESAKSAREHSRSNSSPEFPAGPNPFALPENTDFLNDWDSTADAMGKHLERMS